MSSQFDTGPLREMIRDTQELQRIEDGVRQMDHRQIAGTTQRLLAAGDTLESRILYFKWIKLQGRA